MTSPEPFPAELDDDVDEDVSPLLDIEPLLSSPRYRREHRGPWWRGGAHPSKDHGEPAGNS